jgi:hypothetical protein
MSQLNASTSLPPSIVSRHVGSSFAGPELLLKFGLHPDSAWSTPAGREMQEGHLRSEQAKKDRKALSHAFGPKNVLLNAALELSLTSCLLLKDVSEPHAADGRGPPVDLLDYPALVRHIGKKSIKPFVKDLAVDTFQRLAEHVASKTFLKDDPDMQVRITRGKWDVVLERPL